MAEENGAIQTDAGSSPVPAQSGELISTVEFQPQPAAADKPSEGTLKTEATDKKQPAGKEAEAGKTDHKGDDDRFDKHPRFQELNRRVKESEERSRELEKTLKELSARQAPPKGGDKGEGVEKPPYKDVSKMTPEELLDWQSDDPKGYYQNLLAQAKAELNSDLTQSFEQRQKEDAVVSTYESFAKANPDFDEMWDQGSLQEFMRSNPGHNAISAYHALTADAKLKAATEKAAKDAEATFVKNQRAKRTSDVLPQGPSAPGTFSGDEALKDSRKFGGTSAVLASRLADRRRSQAGV